jgi:hypothetical protein
MGYLPGFEYDLFVSYAHIDDEPDVGQEFGWVTVLKDNLKTRINRRLATESKIWMDQQLVSQARFSAPILDALKHAAGLLIIASPAYLNSYWCGRERGSFLEGLQDHRTAQRPIFVVSCDDFNGAQTGLPKEFGDCLPVKFWQRQTDGAAPQRLGDPLPGMEDRAYYGALNDLSFKIAEEFGRFKGVCEGRSLAKDDTRNTQAVYLAETPDSLFEDSDRVKRSLEQAGFVVLPDRAYPRDTPEAYADAMLTDLARCRAFVQLLDEYPGRVRGWNKTLTALQYETAQRSAVRVCQRRRFKLDPDQVQDDGHRALVFGKNVVNVDLEEFIGDVIKLVPPKVQAAAPQDDDEVMIFVDHDKDDAETAAELCAFFEQQGLGTIKPTAFETTKAVRDDLVENLALCEGLVLVYGRTQATWVAQQLKEAIKSKPLRKRPLPRVVLCHAEPVSDKPDPGIKLPKQRVVDCRQGLDAAAQRELSDFVKSLREAAP